LLAHKYLYDFEVFDMNEYQPSFFDEAERLNKLNKLGDPLVHLNRYITFEFFRPSLEQALAKERKSQAGRPPHDVVFMFKVLVLQRLHNISDQQLEYQINDRQSFQRFLGLHLGSEVPDYTSVWRFREQLSESGAAKKLFDEFAAKLEEQGVITKTGTIVDASFVEVPRQRNSREENEIIKKGGVPEKWRQQPRKLAQKDCEARWTKKNEAVHYGYKDHDVADAQSKLLRDFEVTPANVHDLQELDVVITEKNSGEDLWADSAYRSAEQEERLATLGIRSYIHEKGARGHPLNEIQKELNQVKSRVRSRIEHIYGHMENSMGGDMLEYIGLARIKAAVGLRNLTYNMVRYVQLIRTGQVEAGGGWITGKTSATA
jgi:IS5 family transposase